MDVYSLGAGCSHFFLVLQDNIKAGCYRSSSGKLEAILPTFLCVRLIVKETEDERLVVVVNLRKGKLIVRLTNFL